MAGKWCVVLALVCLLGQTYGRSAEIKQFLNDVADNPDADIERLVAARLSKLDLESIFKVHGDGGVDTTDDDTEDESDEWLGGCSGHECSYCIHKAIITACIHAKYVTSHGFHLSATINGRQIVSKMINVSNAQRMCSRVGGVGKVCIIVDHISFLSEHACVRVKFTIGSGWFSKSFNVNIACFNLPHLDEDIKDQ